MKAKTDNYVHNILLCKSFYGWILVHNSRYCIKK